MSTNTYSINLKRILLFCVLAFGLSWPLALIIQNNGGLFNSPEIFPGFPLYVFILMVYMLTPAISNLLTRLITGQGWNNLKLGFGIKKNWKYFLISWFGPFILIMFGGVVFYLIFPHYFDPSLSGLESYLAAAGIPLDQIPVPLPMLLLINVIQALMISPILNAIPVLGEEFGWRAYLQQELMPLGSRKALIITGIIWGLWHAPIIAMGYNYGTFEQNAYFGAPWTGILMMTLACIWLGIFLGWLTIRTDSVWPAVFSHASINGLAAVTLFIGKEGMPLLLGPTTLGLIGGSGFIILAVILFRSKTALNPIEAEVA